MPGPTGKDPSVRARRNRSSTRTTLSADHDVEAPPLPAGVDWHPMTVEWWEDLWVGETAPQYNAMHIHSLYRKALLVQSFWTTTDLKDRLNIEVRLEKAEADFGLNPMALRRLEWQIEDTEDKKAKGTRRRQTEAPAAPPPPNNGDEPPDPILRLVN